MFHIHRIPFAVAAVAALVACAGVAPAADASLVFVKAHDVWLANDDGSGQYRVTTDGTAQNPWQSPSQADDGTIVAARKLPRAGPLFRMRQNGTLIDRLDLPAMQFGPFDPAVSPDGRTVAYAHGFSRYVNGYLETGTDIRYARTDGAGGTETWPGVSTGAAAPSWIDSGTTFAARGTLGYHQQPGRSASQWWSDYDHDDHFGSGDDLSDGEVAGERVVLTRGLGTPNTLQLYRAVAGTGAKPVPTCTVSNPADGPNGRRYDDPTLSGDGRRIVWGEGDGLWTATTPDGEGCDGWTIAKLVDGGSEPDWGPAPVAPGPRSDAGGPPPTHEDPGARDAVAEDGPVATDPAPTPPANPGRSPAARRPAPAGCAAKPRGVAHEACVYRASAATCRKRTSRSARAACLRSARRARAASVCRRTTTGRSRKACLRRAKSRT